MMQQQSPEFLLGYLFSEQERKIIKELSGRSEPYRVSPPNQFMSQIPLLWFGVRNPYYIHPASRAPLTDLTNELCSKLDKTLKDAFPKRIFNTVVRQERQYYYFITTMTEDRRKLTVSQIEDLLGYKVTIISEEEK